MNENAKKPDLIGPDIGMPPCLSGNGKQGSGSASEEISITSSIEDSIDSSLLATSTEDSTDNEHQADIETGEPDMTRNKYLLNTGIIDVEVNGESAFAGGIVSSRVAPQMIYGHRVDEFRSELDPGKVTGDDVSNSGIAGKNLNQNITNNGSIDVVVKGDTAFGSGISSLIKVEGIFDTDGDGVSDTVDEAPLNGNFTNDLDGDGLYDNEDPDADGDGFYAAGIVDDDGNIIPGTIDYFDNDSDNDGFSNRIDNDDDGDGMLDSEDEILDPISNDGIALIDDDGFLPIPDDEYALLMDTAGGMPENLIETSGILEPEVVTINNDFKNNGDIGLRVVSESESGIAVANGISTDVVWNELQKPIYKSLGVSAEIVGSNPENPEISIIEKNYDSFVNSEGATIEVKATSDSGSAIAFGMRSGTYYPVDEITGAAASERTPTTKRYIGIVEEENSTFNVAEDGYGMVNDGTIEVYASGLETKAFGMMGGYSHGSDEIKEEIVVSAISNIGDITIKYNEASENSEGAGIVAFADQQIEYLPDVVEGGVLLAALDEDGEVILLDGKPLIEDYSVADPETAVVWVDNTGVINVNDTTGGGNPDYGVNVGINDISEFESNNIVTLKEIYLPDADDITEDPIIVENQEIGTLYTVTVGEETYQFVMHAPEDYGEPVPDMIYVVDKDGTITPYVDERYKIGDTFVNVNNSGTITVVGDVPYGIYSEDETGTIINNATGVITVKGQYGAGVKIDGGLTFANNGTIIAKDGAVGVDMSGDGADTLINQGSISSGTQSVLIGTGDEVVIEGEAASFEGVIEGVGGDHVGTVTLTGGANTMIEVENVDHLEIEEGSTLVMQARKGDEFSIVELEEGYYDVTDGMSIIDANTINIDGEIKVDMGFLSEYGRASTYHFTDTLHTLEENITGWENIEFEFDSHVWKKKHGSLIVTKAAYIDSTDEISLRSIAEVLDVNNLNPDFELVLNELDMTSSEEEFENALDQISGNMYVSFPALTLRNTKTFEKNVKYFMQQDGEAESRQYVSLISETGEYDGNDKNEGFDYKTFGFVAATEKKLSDESSMGISYGYANTDADFDDVADNSADVETFHIGAYHKYKNNDWQLTTTTAYEFNDVEAERKIEFNDLSYRTESDFDVNILSLGTELSKVYKNGEWEFKPLAGLTYSYVNQDEIREKGGDVLNVNIDDENYNSITGELGFRLERKTIFGAFNGQIGWKHEFGDVYNDTAATLQGDSSTEYKIYGLQDMEDIYNVGLGVTLGDKEALSYIIDYNFNGNLDYVEHMLSAGVKYVF